MEANSSKYGPSSRYKPYAGYSMSGLTPLDSTEPYNAEASSSSSAAEHHFSSLYDSIPTSTSSLQQQQHGTNYGGHQSPQLDFNNAPLPMEIQRQLEDLIAAQSNGGKSSYDGKLSENESSSGPIAPLAVTIPFFRFFGPTSFAPGHKRIKVELRHDSTTKSAAVQQTVAQVSPDSIKSLNHNNPSPDDGSSPSAHSVKSNESIEQSQEDRDRDALFQGREKVFPKDEIFLHLNDIFFKNLACHFPFLSKPAIVAEFKSGQLPAALACAICALAARFSSHPLLLPFRTTPSARWTSSEPFADTAKKLIVPLLSMPSPETAQVLLLIAWNEFGADRDAGLWAWGGMSMRTIVDLGMHLERSVQSAQTQTEVKKLRLLFYSVFLVDRVISYGTGRRVTLLEDEIDVRLPTADDCELGLLPPNHLPNPWPALVAIIRYRGQISDVLNSPKGNTDDQSRARVEKLQYEMIAYYQSMPPALQFSVQTFKAYHAVDQSPTFFLLHLMFHSVITVLHRPSLLQGFHSGGQVLLVQNTEVSRSSARTLTNMLSYCDLVGPTAILSNPFADQCIFIAAVAFIDERQGADSEKKDGNQFSGSKTPTTTRLLRSFADGKLDVSVTALKNLISRWGGASWVLRTIEQKKRGLSQEEIDPDADLMDRPPVLWPKDPAFLKSWIKREWNNGRSDKVEDMMGMVGIDWDDHMVDLTEPVGLSFTGQGLYAPELTMSLEQQLQSQDSYDFLENDSALHHQFTFPVEQSPDTTGGGNSFNENNWSDFFNDVVFHQ